MRCTDQLFTNKHLLKQFLKAQDYFQELGESNNLSQILISVANELEIKSYTKNTFLFHYDKEQFYDWFIILKGKASIYCPKSQHEIGIEVNLLKQRETVSGEIDAILLQSQNKEQKEKLHQLQLRKQEVEDQICKICSSKYDYNFQKYPESYYKQYPQVLSFKFYSYAGT